MKNKFASNNESAMKNEPVSNNEFAMKNESASKNKPTMMHGRPSDRGRAALQRRVTADQSSGFSRGNKQRGSKQRGSKKK